MFDCFIFALTSQKIGMNSVQRKVGKEGRMP